MKMLDEPVHVVPHRAEWFTAFTVEADRIAADLCVPLDHIAHIGSTAVMGLDAKPIIDIMVGAGSVPPPEAWVAALASLGYEALGEAGVPGRWYFRRRTTSPSNLHIVLLEGDHWRANLALRDYLRRSSAARARYAEAKRAAIANGATTLLAYSDAKAAIVASLLDEAGP